MSEEFEKKIKPMFERAKSLIEFQNFLEDEIKILENKIFHISKSNINEEYFKKELLPRINKIKKIISYIDNGDNMNSKDREVSIQIEALKEMKKSGRFIKNRNIFMKCVEIFEKRSLNISEHNDDSPKVKNNVDIEEKPKYWWEKKEEDENKSAELFEQINKK